MLKAHTTLKAAHALFRADVATQIHALGMPAIPFSVRARVLECCEQRNMLVNNHLLSVPSAKTLMTALPLPPKERRNELILYEVLRRQNGFLHFPSLHMARLRAGIAANFPHHDADASVQYVAKALGALEAQNDYDANTNVQLMTWSGGEENTLPHVAAFYVNSVYATEEELQHGMRAIFVNHEREDPNSKAWNAQYRTRMASILAEANAFEGLIVRGDGAVCEGTRSNFFVVHADGTLSTPPDADVLKGVTREVVLRCCADLGVECRKETLTKADVVGAQAAFITSTSNGIYPIRELEGNMMGSSDHPLVQALRARFTDAARHDTYH